MPTLALRLLLLCCLVLNAGATTQVVTSLANLTNATLSGGVWLVQTNLSFHASLLVNSTGNKTLTLIGDPVICRGMCVLDALQKSGHFVVLPGNTLVLQNLALVNSTRGKVSGSGLLSEPCLGGPTFPNILLPPSVVSDPNDYLENKHHNTVCTPNAYFSVSGNGPYNYGQGLIDCSRYLCGAVIVGEQASLQVSGCLFANNTGVTQGSYEARGGAISILASSTGGFSIANTVFFNNQAVRTAGYNTAGGGAISLDQPWLMVNLPKGPMSIANCTFVGNSAHVGGALDGTLSYGLLTVSQSTFTQNVANAIPFQSTGFGGAVKLGSHYGDRPFHGASSDHGTDVVFEQHAHYVFDTCTFTGNSAVVAIKGQGVLVPKGGAIAVLQGGHGVTVTNSVFTNNSAAQGGAVYQNGNSLMNLNYLNTINPGAEAAAAPENVKYSTTDYFAISAGQDYYSLAPVGWASTYMVTLSGCNFTGNTAVTVLDSATGGRGGAVFMSCGLTYAVNSSFIGNAATLTAGYTSFGGAVAVTDGCQSIDVVTFLDSNFTCANCLFDSNTAVNGGGAVATISAVGAQTRAMVLSFTGGTIRNHAAAQGGAVYLSGADASVTFSGVSLTGNRATVGGAVYTAGSVTIANCVLTGNAAGNGSVVAVASGGSLSYASTSVSGNAAAQYGTTFVAANPGVVAFAASAAFSANTAQAGGIVFYDTTNASSLAVPAGGSAQSTGNYGPVRATVPSSASLLVNGVSPSLGTPAYVTTKSNTAVNLTFTLTDAFGQAVVYWADAAFDVACSSFRTATAASAGTCPAGTVGGAAHTSYFGGVASLQPLVTGAIGSSMLLTATLQSPSVPALLPPGLVYSVNVTVAPCLALETFDTPSLRCVCAAGAYFNGNTGVCTACPQSTFSAAGASTCALCPPGSYSDAGYTKCTPCPAGTYLNSTSSTCSTCPLGTSAPQPGSTACNLNPAGYVSQTQTTFAANLTLAGVSAASFGAAQNTSLAASLASAAGVPAASIVITAVASASAGRHLLQGSALVTYIVVTSSTNTSLLSTTLANTASLATALVSALKASGDAVLRQVTGAVLTAPAVSSLVLSAQPCPAGTFLSGTGTASSCVACAPGSYMPLPGATSCLPCSANTYQPQLGATACLACPDMKATSPPTSSVVLNCSCPYGMFASYDDAVTTFACLPCPPGALCSGALSPSGPTAPPLALDGYWHADNDTSVFYDCDDGVCLAEEFGVWPNCREGHTGLVCAECIPDWRIVDGFCQSCEGQESLAAWPAAKREALAACLGVIAVLIAIPILWWPLFLNVVAEWKQRLGRLAARLKRGGAPAEEEQEEVQKAEDDGLGAGASHHREAGTFALVLGLLSFFAEPLALVVESLQIVSSFKSTTRVPWPLTYRRYVGRLSIINFNFLHLPKSACATPETNLYGEFDGITLSITAILLFIALAWALGLALNLLVLRRGPDVVADYNRRTLAHALLVMQLAYAPLAETIIGVFSCRSIAGSHWLTKEAKLECYVPEHNKYRALGAFWATIYVAGIPAAFLAVLHYYRIPAAAAHLRQVALLRQTVDTAWQRGVKQPEGVNTSKVTPTNISPEHVDALYFGLIHGREAPNQAELASGAVEVSRGVAAVKEEAPMPDLFSHAVGTGSNLDELHKKRLYAVMRWGRKNVHVMHYSWHELQPEEDLRRPGAEEACGELFEHFYPVRWYYKLFETAVKLVLTSVLLFIAPGSAAQILAGVLITFLVLIVYLRMLPYAVKAVRRIAYACNLVIFLLMLLALGLKANVSVGNGRRSDLFYSACVGLVIYALFAAPVVITLNSGIMILVKHNVKHRMHRRLNIPGLKKTKHLELTGEEGAGGGEAGAKYDAAHV